MSRSETKTVYYASIGPELTLYDIDVDSAALIKRGAVTLPANIQYVWPHPSRRYLYAVSSNGGPQVIGDTHRANALTIDQATGALQLHGPAAALPSRPIHCSVDASGAYLLTAYNNPSNVTVHRLNADGTIGAPVAQPENLDTGIYAHQILATPSNDTVLLVTRGNDAKPDKPEDPGAIKTFGFANGVLTGLASIAPGTGLGFGPRHLDFHPTQPWVFVSIERQNKLYVYKRDAGYRPRARADIRQGHAGRSETESAPGRRRDSRPSERQIRLSDQSRLGPRGFERHKSVSRAAKTMSRSLPSIRRAASRP